eukprot:COSAG02_NODE_5566_length_4225_cov_6.497576_2_plen_91_part_00
MQRTTSERRRADLRFRGRGLFRGNHLQGHLELIKLLLSTLALDLPRVQLRLQPLRLCLHFPVQHLQDPRLIRPDDWKLTSQKVGFPSAAR